MLVMPPVLPQPPTTDCLRSVVRDRPTAWKGNMVVVGGSAKSLARVADNSVKPALHRADVGVHFYVVLDGTIRYEHVIPGDAGDEPERVD